MWSAAGWSRCNPFNCKIWHKGRSCRLCSSISLLHSSARLCVLRGAVARRRRFPGDKACHSQWVFSAPPHASVRIVPVPCTTHPHLFMPIYNSTQLLLLHKWIMRLLAFRFTVNGRAQRTCCYRRNDTGYEYEAPLYVPGHPPTRTGVVVGRPFRC